MLMRAAAENEGRGLEMDPPRGKVVVRDRDGRAVRMTGTHTDITERRRAQDARTTGE
jgi:PAS domain-containing protein